MARATGTPPAPTVSSITPSSGVNNGSVSISNLAGTNFLAGAALKLTDQVFAMDGTTEIKDSVHNIAATVTGTPTFETLMGAQAPIITLGVTNLLSAVDYGFETGVGDWQPWFNVCSLASSTDWADTGTHSLKITPISAQSVFMDVSSITTASQPHVLSCKFKGVAGKLYYFSAYDNVGGGQNSATVTGTGSAQSLTFSFTFGTGATRQIYFASNATSSSDVAYIDSVTLVNMPSISYSIHDSVSIQPRHRYSAAMRRSPAPWLQVVMRVRIG